MKTPEDEAFDELERRRGGFRAKRAMAAAKSEWLTGCPTCGMDAGCGCDTGTWNPPQPAQEPPSEWSAIKAILDEYGLQAIDFVANFKAALAQPKHLTEKEKISREMTAEIAAARALAKPAQKIPYPVTGWKVEVRGSNQQLFITGVYGDTIFVDLPVQPAQEPVAWTTMPESEDWCFVSGNKDPNGKLDGKWFPLYTAPPQRKPLTDEAVLDIADYYLYNGGKTYGVLEFARAIEAAHGIKE